MTTKMSKPQRVVLPEEMVADLDWHRVPLTSVRRTQGSNDVRKPIFHPVTGEQLIRIYEYAQNGAPFSSYANYLDPSPMCDWIKANAKGRFVFVTALVRPLHNSKNIFTYDPIEDGRNLLAVSVLFEDATDEALFRIAFAPMIRREDMKSAA